MPYSTVNKPLGVIGIGPGISKSELKEIASIENLSLIQFAEPLSKKALAELAEYVFAVKPQTSLRVFGHYSKECDLSFLKHFTFLKGFSADCLMQVKNAEEISQLSNLEQLSIGIFKLDSFDFINELNADLKKLSITTTFSKKPSIKFLSKFSRIESLYLEGQTNGISEISKLTELKELTLRSITVPNLDFLQYLKNLWSIEIKLGGIKNFAALTKLQNLKYLELWQINKLSDISFISDLNELQYLFIQSLRNVESLPNLDKNYKLRRIYLENLKGLKELKPLKFAPALEEFYYTMAQNQNPANFKDVLENRTLRQIVVKFGSASKNKLFEKMVDLAGKEKFMNTRFQYV